MEPDAPLVELVDEADELTGSPPQPIEVEDDEDDKDVAFAELVEAGVEVRALMGRSRGVILEDPLASGFVVRVELAVEHLAPFDRGDAGLPDEAHGVCAFPKNPIGPQHIAKRKFRGCRGRNRPDPPIWGSARGLADKHWIVGNGPVSCSLQQGVVGVQLALTHNRPRNAVFRLLPD